MSLKVHENRKDILDEIPHTKPIKVDLTMYGTKAEFERLITDNNLSGGITADEIMEFKSKYEYLYLDPTTFYPIFVSKVGKFDELIITGSYLSYTIFHTSPIKMKKRPKSKDVKALSIDNILDKINISGMESLSNKERRILESHK